MNPRRRTAAGGNRRRDDGEPSSRVRLQDVARAAGVAPSTASRAFTQPERVNFETVETVMHAAAELGYRRRPASATPTRTLARTIHIMVQDISNPFFSDLVKGAVSQARAAGYLVMLADAEETATVERVLMERIPQAVDGMITAARWTSDSELQELARAMPIVLFNREVPGVSSVVAGTADGSHRLMEHLHALGHRKVVYCSGPRNSWTNAQRKEALMSRAAELDVDVVEVGPFVPVLDQGAAAAGIAMAHHPTAIIAFNDQLAIGIIAHLQAQGIRVPQQVSVAGFDNTYGSSFVQPGLTCMDAPVEPAGRTAVDLLMAQIRGDRTPQQVRLEASMKVRGSTGSSS
jgi:DNA-binding LacI/PurR family transcriptional regulator